MPTHSHIARAPTAVARVQALVDGSIWVKTGAVAISGWQALSAHDGIVAAEAKAAAAKALAKAEADLIVPRPRRWRPRGASCPAPISP